MYFINGFLATCGVACAIPVLFIAHGLSRKYLGDSTYKDSQTRSVELMEERNRLDSLKVDALAKLAVLAERANST